jgi:hypothetical protein
MMMKCSRIVLRKAPSKYTTTFLQGVVGWLVGCCGVKVWPFWYYSMHTTLSYIEKTPPHSKMGEIIYFYKKNKKNKK